MSLLDRAPVFVAGTPFSGADWLLDMLGDHPRLARAKASPLLPDYLGPLWKRWRRDHEAGAPGLTEDELLDESRRLCRRVLPRLTEDKPGAVRLAAPAPEWGRHLPLLARVFPDAVVLHVVRDGRDVAALLRQRGGRPSSAREAAAAWAESVDTTGRDLALFAQSATVRYEELVGDGPAALGRLLERLGLPLSAVEVEAIHDRRRHDPGPAPERLSAAELAAVEHRAGAALRGLGYEGAYPTAVAAGGFVSTAAGDGLLWAAPRRVDTIERNGAQMLPRERLFLYATVLARAPLRCLEIGVAQGGSTRLIHAALSDLGRGRLVAVDPEPALDDATAQELQDRVTFLRGPSPDMLPQARETAGGDFDFVLVDGDHSADGVRRDLEGVARVTVPGALVLCHDAYFGPTAAGIDAALAAGAPYVDAGVVSTTRHPGLLGEQPVAFAGLRLLTRVDRPQPAPARLPVRIARKLRRVLWGRA